MIIYLNGTSSSGKTTIAKAIQEQTNYPLFYFSVDTYLGLLAPKVLQARKNKIEFPNSLPWLTVVHGYFECLATLHKSGNSVIADCPIHSAKHRELFDQSLALIREKLIIAVDCDLGNLRSREKTRLDRDHGLAESQFPTIHKHLEYDLRADTSKDDPFTIAKYIIAKIHESNFEIRLD